MTNHPNRGWRSRWSIDLEAATATHIEGWVFKFRPVEGEPGSFEGECISPPAPLTQAHLANAPRVAKEAGDIYLAAYNALPTGKRRVGRPAAVAGRRVMVYLDDESLAIAAELGDGNVSEGIRKGLKQVAAASGKIHAE